MKQEHEQSWEDVAKAMGYELDHVEVKGSYSPRIELHMREPERPIDLVRLDAWIAILVLLFATWTLAAYYVIIPAVQAVWGWLA